MREEGHIRSSVRSDMLLWRRQAPMAPDPTRGQVGAAEGAGPAVERPKTRELDQQRCPSQDPQLPDDEARGAGQSVGEMPRDWPDGLLQGPRGQPVRRAGLQLPHAHGRRCAPAPSVRRRRVREGPGAPRPPGSLEVPRWAPLHRSTARRQGDDRARRRNPGRRGHAGRPGNRRRRPGLPLHGRLARHGGGRGGDHGAVARGGEEDAVHPLCRLRRRPHAGRHPVAHADAAHDHRRADACASRIFPTSSC